MPKVPIINQVESIPWKAAEMLFTTLAAAPATVAELFGITSGSYAMGSR